MTATYDLIASNVLTSSASSVTFSSIPATYRDLVLVIELRSSTGFTHIDLTLNSDTGSNYHRVWMIGNGSNTSSLSESPGVNIRLTSSAQPDATNAVLCVTQVLDYSATDKHKTILSRSNVAAYAVNATAGRWASTSAVNAITLTCGANTFASGGTFYLYGIVS